MSAAAGQGRSSGSRGRGRTGKCACAHLKPSIGKILIDFSGFKLPAADGCFWMNAPRDGERFRGLEGICQENFRIKYSVSVRSKAKKNKSLDILMAG